MKNNRNSVIKFPFKANVDIYYLIITAVVFIFDILTTSKVFEGLAFVLIMLGFVFSVLPNKNNIKDERVSYIKLYSGYIGFMFTVIIIGMFSFLHRYLGFSMSISDLLRYIALSMYFIFSLTYAVIKRKM